MWNYPCKEKSDNHFRACAHGAGADTVWKSISFCQEIPPELLSGKIYEPKTKEEPIEQSTFQKARKAFRTVPSYGGSGYGKEVGEGYGSTFHSSKATKPVYTKVENQRDFGSVGGALSYQVGDRVRHIKFGDGEVMAIVSGAGTMK